MDPVRWQRIEQLYHGALERPFTERAAFLAQACAGDEAIRREVEALLDTGPTHNGIFAMPALQAAAQMVSDPASSILTGRRLGVYHLQDRIGVGGMGEVYRARDTRLGRDVAIKMLPRPFMDDRARLARFEREARVLAALNHPNIATIHGLEESEGVRGLVMELIEGETLAERVQHRPVPLPECLAIARQIADALDAAHEKGIVHRDLKPANIKITADGTVKVLDFGLAATTVLPGGQLATEAPTVSSGATGEGVIAGTVAYMSPEQARGQAVDKRTDIWAFGCVLYELLTGRAAFAGQSISDTIAAILQREPEWGALPVHVPAAIRQLLRRCLEKERKRRLHDIADAGIEIDEVQSAPRVDQHVALHTPPRHGRVVWIPALAFATLMAAIALWAFRPPSTASETWLEITTPPTTDPSLAISPDGLKVVFVARSAGQPLLWLRTLDSPSARPLMGTEGATGPFWSPDGRSIGFFVPPRLKRIDVDSGSVKTLASDSAAPQGASWNSDGIIVYAPRPGGAISRIPADGGEPTAATRLESPQQRGHWFPQFLPDGRQFLFLMTGGPEVRGVYVGQLDGFDTKRVFDADGPAVYATTTGHLLFVRGGKLLAQAFDPARLVTRGDPFPIAEEVGLRPSISASPAGAITFRRPSISRQRQLVWHSREGWEIDKVVYPGGAALGPSLSRDGRRIAVYRDTDGNMDIWSYETGLRAWDRITFDAGDDIYPLWSPDGTRMVFASARNGNVTNLYQKLLIGAPGSEEQLLATADPKYPTDWSADGRFLLYDSLDRKRSFDIWALPLEGDRKPFEVVRTDFSEGLGEFSPDGKWIAYQSDKTGRFEVYIRPFPGPGGDTRVSPEGGTQARWNPNGTELFFIAADDRLTAVPIRFSSNGTSVELGTPVGLFVTNVGSTAILTYRPQYMVSPDSRSFVMNSRVEEGVASPITVLLNWNPDLRR